MSEEEKTFSVKLKRGEGFVFHVDFGQEGFADLIMDEPEPVGGDKGPNASRVLASAIGNCLSASLLFCLQKSRVGVEGLETRVKGYTRRNEEGRWRISNIEVEIGLDIEGDVGKIQRCADIFENFCVVSQSIKEGIPISVNVTGF